MLLSKWLVTVSQRRISSLFGLWTLAPELMQHCLKYMQSMPVLENNILQFIY